MSNPADWYGDADQVRAAQQPRRDNRIASAFRPSDHWERVAAVAETSPEKLDAATRLSLAHYLGMKAAAERVQGDGQ